MILIPIIVTILTGLFCWSAVAINNEELAIKAKRRRDQNNRDKLDKR